MNFQDTICTEERIKKMAYIVICAVIFELLVWGKRIAVKGELKKMRKLIDPVIVDVEKDGSLLRGLNEPHVKIASALADYGRFEVLVPYSLVNLLDDVEVLEDQWACDMGWKLFWRYMFGRVKPKVRERYINFNRVLLTAQRALFELLKLMMTQETKAFGPRYRSNYSSGRLKALMKNNGDRNALLISGFILKLKAYEFESRALLLEQKKSEQNAVALA